MISRRQVLGTMGVTLTAGGFGSCLSHLGVAKTGYIQAKVVSLEWKYNGQQYVDEPLNIMFDRAQGDIVGSYDPDMVGDSVHSPTNIVVSKATRNRLATRFNVDYLIRVCGTDFSKEGSWGCSNRWTSREDFNRVQLGDRAEVRVSGDDFDVIDVYKNAATVNSVDIRTFDFAELHKEHGISPHQW
ncbi:hypothetical protein [Haladaptatus caseinilyticus]|uniref:hypothetical protein n=1 Tax=Haladaptatus caseinilyticus TaxID=2993314 RepID=UPI00224B395F|nr:hypothetical protein [Haladaptatus caseinilyticus]